MFSSLRVRSAGFVRHFSSANDVVIVAATRTAVGNLNGGLASLPPSKLGQTVIQGVLKKTGVKGTDIDEVILGQVIKCGEFQNPARAAAVNAGVRVEAPAWGLDQLCASGLRAVALGYQQIKAGDAKIVIAGGQESMTQAPHWTMLRNGTKMGNATLTDSMIDSLTCTFGKYHMGMTAENVAAKFNISKKEQDTYAAQSHNRAEAAQKAGKFKEEITPVVIPGKKGDVIVDQDEFIRKGCTFESLQAIKPAFKKDGTVTAGNASGINDGAAAVMLMSRAEADKRGLKVMAKIVNWATAGLDPAIMGVGPIYATRKVLEKSGWTLKDCGLVEANEAFAAQACAVSKELGFDASITNVNGGAIALGHPIGASGCRILVTLLHEMERRNVEKGLATLCVGGGMGIAMTVQRDMKK